MKKQEIISIFEKMNFRTRDSAFGRLIIMDPLDAYIFSSITGANYLLSEYGMTTKGRSEVFVHRSIFSNGYYIYSPGLFSRDKEGFLTEGNSAEWLEKKYPSIFKGKKYLLIEDINNGSLSNIEKDVFEKIKTTDNPENYILYKNRQSGSSAEPFLEYLLCVNFIKNGYIVENQVPWFQQNLKYKGKIVQGGIPDFSAFKIDFMTALKEYGFLDEKGGVAINILPVLKNFKKIKPQTLAKKTKIDYELIIAEAKCSISGITQAQNQINKYAAVELAKQLFIITPKKSEVEIKTAGKIFIEEEAIKIIPPLKNSTINLDSQKEDADWLKNYIKMLLLGNLSFIKIKEFVSEQRDKYGLPKIQKYEACHLLDAVINSNDKEYLEYLVKNL